LNNAYFHWQLLDDVADLAVDCRDGILGGPAYVLLSQGKLASTVLQEGGIKDKDHSSISNRLSAALTDSDLLCSPFIRSPLCSRSGFVLSKAQEVLPFSETGVRYALVNAPSEIGMALTALCSLRIEQASELANSWRDRNWANAAHAILNSGAPGRIVMAANDAGMRASATSSLRYSRKAVLATLELLIEHSYRKAANVALTRSIAIP
jgi:hypothetical protein